MTASAAGLAIGLVFVYDKKVAPAGVRGGGNKIRVHWGMNMFQKKEMQLLAFLRMALVDAPSDCVPQNIEEWGQLCECAEKQGVLSFMMKGAKAHKQQMPPEVFGKIRNHVLAATIHNDRMMAFQQRLVELMEGKHIPCAILKGSSVAVCYPQSEVRALGDIDLLIRPEDTERTKQLLVDMGYHSHETGHPFHLDFYGDGPVVEMHWQASNYPDSPGGRIVQQIMQNALHATDIAVKDGYRFPVLKPLYQAFSLLLHMERHMTSGGIGLRQLCDWAAFITSVDQLVLEKEILPEFERCGLLKFAEVMTATCVAHLSTPRDKAAWCSATPMPVCNAVMADILRSGNMGQANEGTHVSNMFVERGNDGAQDNAVKIMFQKLNQLAHNHFPVTRKCPVLLPVFWIYIPLRYWIRSLLGKRDRIAVGSTLSTIKDRRKLYNELRLFEITNAEGKN